MPKLSRRNILIGGAALAGAGAYLGRPDDNSGPRNNYFVELQAALKRAGIATPTLIIDKKRLDANIDVLNSSLANGMEYRIVTKSLPSENLIRHIAERTGTNRLMTFNLPMLIAQSASEPAADQLLGKPLPVAAARQFLEEVRIPEARERVQWLIDTPERLAQYAALASETGASMRISLEIDVGLHRGGFREQNDIVAAVKTIEADPNLSFSGLMGYEAHVSGHPELLGLRERALQDSWEKYKAAKEAVKSVIGEEALNQSVLNAAGSPTFRNYANTEIANEVSVGSALVKPSKFDLSSLDPFSAASFIATPVLKTYDQTELPLTGLGFVDSIQQTMNPNSKKAIYIYGGYWKAVPVDPPGLETNSIWGNSSNQEMFNGGENLNITVDDFVFFRPMQSEAVFLQFGDIAIYDGEDITEFWPVYPASG
ncbi:DSD1 family PLP-dependent enzyme [Sneathiella sp. P13V-1]|uniref:alanine racemase n=1 Tax=Sneathiella sp. P13V-1 TaxID=2697366 RepID=UPI00187BB1BC|nr:alanine racemase [Sneathiella sp. P13V-1]MBE7637762.1 DSD1 family PLP-dependent enzyme [Sneathiella sp. P13V-1]